MNHIQVFFNTKIKNIGLLSDIGNFFLAPVRQVFSGKTTIIEHGERDGDSYRPKKGGNIAKVSSFFRVPEEFAINGNYVKTSKQNSILKSSGWGYNPHGDDPGALAIKAGFGLLILSPFIIVGVILGSICKALSYFSPVVREAHNTVKQKLTPKDNTLGSEDAPLDNETLKEQLNTYLQTGQKTNALTIYAQKSHVDMDGECLKIIKNINPLKLILVGDWHKGNFDIEQYIPSKHSPNKLKKWDTSALNPRLPAPCPQPVNPYDYFVPKPSLESKDVKSVGEALKWSRTSFFSPKHTIFVVQGDPIQAYLQCDTLQPSAPPSISVLSHF